jgi:osmoprotectant transport system substrate-binding protein
MAITRRESLGLFAGALVLPGCGGRRYAAVRVGSKSSGENETIAEIYALALERSKIAVERHMNLGDTRAALGAILRGDIDVYPEYDTVKSAHAGVTRLAAAAMDDSPCLATSQYAAEAYWLLTLATCAKIAPTLRLAATADFLAPNGWLQQLQRAYGGFHFKSVVAVSPGQQYDAVSSGDADVAN